MRVCHLINLLAPGGAPNLVLDIVRHTPESAEIEYTICVLETSDGLGNDLDDEIQIVNLDEPFRFDPLTIIQLVKFFREEDFGIIHSHLPYAQFLGRIAAEVTGVKAHVSTQHNVPQNYHPITGGLERLTRTLDDRTIAVSQGVQRAFTGQRRLYRPGQIQQWCTIPNGVDVASIHESVHEIDIDAVKRRWGVGDSFIYLNVSRYTSAKAQTDLISAMESVLETVPEAHLFIVGWGDREDKLRNAVKESDVEQYVTITGRVPSVIEFYAIADVFVSSSVFEGLPLAHLEAMSAELPLVATDIPGVREIVMNGDFGVLVPPRQPDKLAEAMISLYNEPQRDRFGKVAYDHVSAQFTIEQTVRRYNSLYRELVQ